MTCYLSKGTLKKKQDLDLLNTPFLQVTTPRLRGKVTSLPISLGYIGQTSMHADQIRQLSLAIDKSYPHELFTHVFK